MDNPYVSVCLITYNQAPYIAGAIEGVLRQKTDFPFELVIGEDGSSDETARICLEYAKKFPDLIRLFCRSREDVLYVDGYPTSRNNFLKTFRACGGSYIAYCEGDDYWQDERKLQKQVDFLRSHPEYGMVHSVADVFYQSKNRLKKYKGGYRPPEGDIYNDLFYRLNIFSSSVCCRAQLLRMGLDELERFGSKWISGDIVLWLTIAHHSRVHYMDEPMAVYRIVEGSSSHRDDIVRIIKFRRSLYRTYTHFLRRFGGSVTQRWLSLQFLRSCYVDILKAIERTSVKRLRRLLSP
jgi:glycosyltransferase involved in cell wall biosynthesis